MMILCPEYFHSKREHAVGLSPSLSISRKVLKGPKEAKFE